MTQSCGSPRQLRRREQSYGTVARRSLKCEGHKEADRRGRARRWAAGSVLLVDSVGRRREEAPSAEDARQEGALLAGDAMRRLDVASSPAASVGEGARRLRCRGAPPARLESGDAPRRGGARQPALAQARAHSRRRMGRTREGPSAPAGEMRRGWGDSRRPARRRCEPSLTHSLTRPDSFTRGGGGGGFAAAVGGFASRPRGSREESWGSRGGEAEGREKIK
jgi:hypothetical protein